MLKSLQAKLQQYLNYEFPDVQAKFRKLSTGHKSGKGQFSFQSQRKAMPKNAQTTTQLLISHTSKVMLKSL